MTLYELSMEYRAQAELLHERLRLVRRLEAESEDEWERSVLRDRIRILSGMWRDTREVAALTGTYYERSCGRNAKYII